MPLWPIIAGAAVLFVGWTLIPGVRHWRYRRVFRERSSARAVWAERFPEAMPAVERALTIFCDAFRFDRQYLFHFRPDDKVADVCRGTTGPVSDEMQLETVLVEMDEWFGVDLADSFDENTTLRDMMVLALERPTGAD